MNRQFFKYLAVAVIVISTAFTSCKEDEPKLTLGSEIVELTAIQTDEKTVSIQSNIEWSVAIEQTDDWLIVSQMSGNGNGSLVITAQDNDDFENQRSATITVTGEGVQAKTIAVTQKNAAILLEKYSYPGGHYGAYRVYEYDAQHRITKRSYSGAIVEVHTIKYDTNRILIEYQSGGTTTFIKNGNKISIDHGGHFTVEMELNAQGLPEKLTTEHGDGMVFGRYEGTYTFTWENGNLIQEDREYYREEDGKKYEDIVTTIYTYDDKKSPFYYCATPKWFLMYWRGIDYCSENNYETLTYLWNSTTSTQTLENTYNSDGFLATRRGSASPFTQTYDYMKR
jgi:hypothetical protein